MTPETPHSEYGSCTVAAPSTCNTQLSAPQRATGHATPLQPGGLKRLAAAVLGRNQARNPPATPTQKPMQLSTPENGARVASGSRVVPPPEAALHAALARAAEGLPITLTELIEAFGEEGAADWAEGYTPHCRPEFLRAFAVAVSERLERERGDSQERHPGAVTKAPAPGPLDGLPLLREDREFIEARTLYRRDRASLLIEYAERWREAAAAKFVPHRQANAGRRAANAWLREVTR